MMHALAKVGFNQSYTYFTWRNTQLELVEYIDRARDAETPTTSGRTSSSNTPDILTGYLADGGRPAFEARLVLAATLSPSYGIYSGFELVENVPRAAGSEEYLDSEKYEAEDAHDRRTAAAADRAAERDPPRATGRSSASTTSRSSRPRTTACSPTRSGTRPDTVIVCVNIDPIAPAEGLRRVPAGARPAARRSSCRICSPTSTLRLADRRQLRPAPARRRPRDARPMSTAEELRQHRRTRGRPSAQLTIADGRGSRRSGSRPTRCGSSAPSSTRSTSAASPTATTTASATSAA